MFRFFIFLFCFVFISSLFGVDDSLSFSQEELAYLEKKRIIKMCNNPNWEPIEFALNDNMSQMSGIVIDVLGLLEKKLAIEFQNVPTKDWNESQQFLKEGRCDMIPAASKTAKRAEYALFTDPYLSYKIAIITRTSAQLTDDLSYFDGKKMTRRKGSGLIDIVAEKNPKIVILQTDNYLESLLMVQDKRADFTVAPVPEASYYMSKFGLYDLQISGYLETPFDLSMAIKKDEPLLVSILQKGLYSIEKHEMKQIHDNWTNITFKESLLESRWVKILFFVIMGIILLLVYRQYLIHKTNKNLKNLVEEKTKELEKLNHELRDLNENLEQRIVFEVEKTKKIEAQLFQSEKMAAMGEMIGNIAHQWRQPLSLISTSSTGVLMQQEFGVLNQEYLTNRMNDINNATQFLSKTIDDFRDLVKGELVIEHFLLLENIQKCLLIEEPILRHNKITLIKEIDPNILITSYQNPIIQSLMNIINNAKDVLVEKNIETKVIFLSTRGDDTGIFISVKDTGGGISESIMEHIFEPYFTTKHKSQGTGLGLHMTYMMITNELQGEITVKNRTFEFEGEIHNGAEFIIKLPKVLIGKQDSLLNREKGE